jgi:hypothetical protein
MKNFNSLAAAEDAAAQAEGAVIGDSHSLIVTVKGDDSHHLQQQRRRQ